MRFSEYAGPATTISPYSGKTIYNYHVCTLDNALVFKASSLNQMDVGGICRLRDRKFEIVSVVNTEPPFLYVEEVQ